MTRRGTAVFRLLLVAGLLLSPESNRAAPDSVVAGASGSESAPKISVSAVAPAITPATSEPATKWLAARRDHKRTYTRLWALAAVGPPVAAVLAFALLRIPQGWRARFSVAGRAVSPRAPPASASA